MPNHIRNRITANNMTPILKLLAHPTDRERPVDFNRVIPRPDYIVDESVSCAVKSAAEIALGLIDFGPETLEDTSDIDAVIERLHKSTCTRQLLEGPMPKDFSDEDFDAFIGMLWAHRKSNGGAIDWYDWNCKNWGTKWNAYNMSVGHGALYFDTAWSAPRPVIQEIAKRLPVAFIHDWADEDTGSNVGTAEYCNGRVSITDLAKTKAGYELAFELGSGDAADYEVVNGRYVWREEEGSKE